MISILIPIYNGVHYLDQSLPSVLMQTYKDWEVIIGINGHPPNSDIEKKAYNIKNICCEHFDHTKDNIKIIYYTTKGKAATLNAMIKDCKYDLIALLDVDDVWHPHKLEKQSAFWNDYDVVSSKCEYFEDLRGSPNIPTGDVSNYDFLITNPIINCSAIIRKELCDWDTTDECLGIEDYELWLRLRLQNKTFYVLAENLSYHRVHKTSFFNNTNHLRVPALVKKYRQLFQT